MKFFNVILAGLAATVTAQHADKFNYERLVKNDTLLLIVDIQEGLYQLTRDFDPTLYKQQALAHAALGKAFDLPVVMTTSADTGPNGPLMKEMINMYPNAPSSSARARLMPGTTRSSATLSAATASPRSSSLVSPPTSAPPSSLSLSALRATPSGPTPRPPVPTLLLSVTSPTTAWLALVFRLSACSPSSVTSCATGAPFLVPRR
uniref:Isochorismatase-like domain-containing protein n=1 Tax=Bionectria ochroleuca TaxID=29856 RepID=A0A8H7TRC9_BIOOC